MIQYKVGIAVRVNCGGAESGLFLFLIINLNIRAKMVKLVEKFVVKGYKYLNRTAIGRTIR